MVGHASPLVKFNVFSVGQTSRLLQYVIVLHVSFVNRGRLTYQLNRIGIFILFKRRCVLAPISSHLIRAAAPRCHAHFLQAVR